MWFRVNIGVVHFVNIISVLLWANIISKIQCVNTSTALRTNIIGVVPLINLTYSLSKHSDSVCKH